MKQVIGAVTGLLINCSAAIAQEPSLHPKLTKEQFLSFSAAAAVAGMYCGKLELNADFFTGYQYGTGIYPPLDPYFGSEMARLEKEAKNDPKSYCSATRRMFYKGNKPKPLVAPLLIDKP
ncbi:hypothetical protein [Rhizobium leguminosarum]|uniref:hypothetical protein n=1 Tax=Rhizobium leguminosarum TaxID=384 RepID=UPI00143F1B85|nr:hypothetical protein [Rhizobium leguminosarum]NKL17843.1 hypothetical protein [Rhizobium leguminosarum bv. viciae]NKL53127.1 hypothetical protein [Rhizobium leguminosarum bv. viciae]